MDIFKIVVCALVLAPGIVSALTCPPKTVITTETIDSGTVIITREYATAYDVIDTVYADTFRNELLREYGAKTYAVAGRIVADVIDWDPDSTETKIESVTVVVEDDLKGNFPEDTLVFVSTFLWDPFYLQVVDSVFLAFFDVYDSLASMGVYGMGSCDDEPVGYYVVGDRIIKAGEHDGYQGLSLDYDDFKAEAGGDSSQSGNYAYDLFWVIDAPSVVPISLKDTVSCMTQLPDTIRGIKVIEGYNIHKMDDSHTLIRELRIDDLDLIDSSEYRVADIFEDTLDVWLMSDFSDGSSATPGYDSCGLNITWGRHFTIYSNFVYIILSEPIISAESLRIDFEHDGDNTVGIVASEEYRQSSTGQEYMFGLDGLPALPGRNQRGIYLKYDGITIRKILVGE